MARQTQAAIVFALGAALALGACGRKGQLEAPGAPVQEAPAGTPNPEAKPDEVKSDGARISPRVAPTPMAKPEAAKTAP